MKKRNLIKIGISAFLAFAIIIGACKKKELIKVIGIIQGVAYDGNTNAALDGVTGTLMMNGEVKTVTSTVDGYTFTDLIPGEYSVTFSLTGYTTVVGSEEIENNYDGAQSTVRGGANYYETRVLNPVMYPLTGALKGTIYKSINGTKTPAVGVTVVLDFGNPQNVGDEDENDASYGITPNEYTATTDANGDFSFADVPAAPATVFTLAFNDGTTDFSTTSTSVSLKPGIIGDVGDLSISNSDGSPALASDNFLNGTLTPDASLVLGFSKEIDQTSFTATLYDESGTSGSIVETTIVGWTKAVNTVTIDPVSNLNPGSTYTLLISGKSTDGIDINIYSYNYNQFRFTVTPGIQFVSSNLETSEDVYTEEFAVASDITVNFNISPNEAQTLAQGHVTLYDAINGSSGSGNPVDAVVTFSGNTVTINPDASLEEDREYSLDYSIYSQYTLNSTSKTGTSAIDFKTISTLTAPGQVTGYTIDMGTNWTADYNDGTSGNLVNFQFTRVAGAEKYEIWAKDDNKNLNYVNLGYVNDLGDDIQDATQDIAKMLPTYFDYFEDDGTYYTPLGHGTTVTYKMRAVNDAGNGTWSTEIPIKDQTAFDGGDLMIDNNQNDGTSPNVTANNTAGTTALTITMQFSIYGGRYTTKVAPSIALYNGGTVVSGANITFAWDDHDSGTITFVVPIGADYSPYEIRVSGVSDSSGNIQDSGDYESEFLW